MSKNDSILTADAPSKPFAVVVYIEQGNTQSREVIMSGANLSVLVDDFNTAVKNAGKATKADAKCRFVNIEQILVSCAP